MAWSLKHRRLEELQDGESRDRISNLPEVVRGHILSFLPTKYAVKTSILSKKWRFTWASVSALDFDGSLVSCCKVHRKHQNGCSCFRNFVNMVLIACNAPSIHKFRLKCWMPDMFYVNAWISAALMRGVEELDLWFAWKDIEMPSITFTNALFACQNLVVLKLCSCCMINVPASIHFPSLKKLHLFAIRFPNDDLAHKFFSSCPMLEDLLLEACEFSNLRTLNISAPALKSLRIECEIDEDGSYLTQFCDCEIVVDAPNLEFLRYQDFLVNGYSVKNLHSLIRADIIAICRDGETGDVGKSGFELLRGISKAKSLILSGNFLKVFSHCNGQDLPTFHNLTTSVLGWDECWGQLLPYLLDKSPNLEVLVLGKDRHYYFNIKKFKWNPLPHVPECLLHHLKTIKIGQFNCLDELLEVIKYLLEHARVLNEILVSPCQSEKELKVSRQLLKYLVKS